MSFSTGTGVISSSGWGEGTDTITVSASNSCFTSSGSMQIESYEVAPVTAADAALTAPYNTPTTLALPVGGAYTSVSILVPPTKGTASISGTTLTYTGAPDNYGGFDELRYSVAGESGPATGLITITNQTLAAPSLASASVSVPYKGQNTVTLIPSGHYTSLAIVADGAHGTSVLSGNNLTYTVTGNYLGSDQVKVKAIGPQGDSAETTVDVTITPPAAPVAGDSTASLAFGSGATLLPMTQGGYWETSSIVTAPSHGTATIVGNAIRYTPTTNYEGPDSVEFELTGPVGSATGRIDITNQDAPVYTITDQAWSTAFNTPYSATIMSAEGVAFGPKLTGSPAHGSFAGAAGKHTYTPTPGFFGQDVFTMTWTGPTGKTTSATMTAIVAPPAAPVASNVTANTGYKAQVSIPLAASGYVTGYAVHQQGGHGSAAISGTNLVYTPADGFAGQDVIEFIALGASSNSAPATATVTVAAPGAPSVQNASATIEQDQTASIPLAATGVYSSLTVVDAPAHGTASVSGSTATYQPASGWNGADTFTVQANGLGGPSPLATISITVEPPPPPPPPPPPTVPCWDGTTAPTADECPAPPPPPPPVLHCDDGTTVTPPTACPVPEVIEARPAEASTPLNTPVAMNLMRLVQGAPVRALDVIEQAKRGVVEVQEGEATYTPDENFTGTDRFKYRATAISGATAEATVTVVVERGSVPTVQDVRIEVIAGVPYTVDLAQAAAGGPFEGADIVEAPSKGDASTSGTVLTYAAPIDFEGEAKLGFTVRNTWGPSASAQLLATVYPAALPATELRATVLQGKTVEVDLTQGARGGPFTNAAIVAFDKETANATIERRGDRFVLIFSSKGTFAGTARIGFTLANARTISPIAFAVVEVIERENPALNREVTALVNAQATTAQRFGDAQLGNVGRRLEGLHGGRRENSLSIGLPRELDVLGHEAEARQSFAADVDKALGRNQEVATSNAPHTQGQAGDVAVWLGGSLELGRARGNVSRSKARFNTGGISAGVDAPIGDKVYIGAGVGFGKDDTKIGDRGSKSAATSTSLFGYGSYQPGKVTFFDAVLGLTKINFDSDRYVEATGNTVTGNRRGQQVFGAFSAGWEHSGPKLMISPYGRLQFVFTDLSGFVEQGDDTYALAFLKQKVSDVEAAIGVRGQVRYELREGELVPTFRLEYRQKLHTGGVARMRYADWADSPIYSTQPYYADESSALVGVGGSYRRGDWTFGGEVEATAGNSGSKTTRVRASGSTKF